MIDKAKSLFRAGLPKNASVRGIGVLVGGTMGAQLLTVAAAPLLTRLFTPEDFGLLAVYASLLAIISVVSSLRYELAIPLPEDDVEAANIAVLSLLLVVITTVLSGVPALLLAIPLAGALGIPTLADYLWLFPVGVLFAGGYNVFNYWSIRTNRFGIIASTRIRQSLVTLFIQISAFKLGSLALLLGQVVGQSVGTTSLARPALAIPAFRSVSWSGIMYVMKRYRKFPFFSTPAGLANTASTQLVPIFFASFFGSVYVGYYALANRIVGLPMALVGGAVAQVFLGQGKKSLKENKLSEKTLSIHSYLAQISMPFLFILLLTGPETFGLIFGKEWRSAGIYAQYLSPWLYLAFSASPISSVNTLLEKMKFSFLFDAGMMVARLSVISIAPLFFSANEVVLLFGLVSAGLVFIFLYFTFKFLDVPLYSWIGIHLRVLLTGFIIFASPYFFGTGLRISGEAVFFGLLIISCCYYFFLIKKNNGNLI